MSNYRLDEESLLNYAKCVSAIRREITQWVEELNDENGAKVDEVSEKETVENQKQYRVNLKVCIADFQSAYNPCHPSRKRKSLRQVDSDTRLKIVKLVASNTRTCGEVARLFNVKVQAVYDLLKDLKKSRRLFVKKR